MVTTFAGSSQGKDDGVGTDAQFSYPCGIACHPDGYLYVADYWNFKIRKISAPADPNEIFDSKSTPVQKLELYPNPINGKLNIKDVKCKGVAAILNGMGETIVISVIDNNTIDVSNLRPGIYLLKVQTDNGPTVQSFVKDF